MIISHKINNLKSSIVIYTHNNEKNIVNIVATCCKITPEHEVIILNDSSDDNTNNLLDTLSGYYDFIHLTFKNKIGIGSAIVEGIILSTSEILVLIDASVENISKEFIGKMLQLINRSACDIVETHPSNPFIDNDMVMPNAAFGTKALVKKEIFPLIQDLLGVNYNLDFFIDLYYRLNRKRIQYLNTDESCLQDSNIGNLQVRKKDGNVLQDRMAEYYLADLELVIKRLKNLFLNHNQYSPFSIYSVQKDLNQRIEELHKITVLKTSGMKRS